MPYSLSSSHRKKKQATAPRHKNNHTGDISKTVKMMQKDWEQRRLGKLTCDNLGCHRETARHHCHRWHSTSTIQRLLTSYLNNQQQCINMQLYKIQLSEMRTDSFYSCHSSTTCVTCYQKSLTLFSCTMHISYLLTYLLTNLFTVTAISWVELVEFNVPLITIH